MDDSIETSMDNSMLLKQLTLNFQDKKFDVLVSEWMGYFLLYEGMLDSVIAARDKYLSPGGLILPNDCFMHLFAISDEDR